MATSKFFDPFRTEMESILINYIYKVLSRQPQNNNLLWVFISFFFKVDY